jgi:hypothetical protein
MTTRRRAGVNRVCRVVELTREKDGSVYVRLEGKHTLAGITFTEFESRHRSWFALDREVQVTFEPIKDAPEPA